MRITRVDCHVLLDPSYDADATSSSQDDVVVELHTDEGLVGIGETDLNAWVARAIIEAPGTHTMDRGIADQLVGADPLDEGLWQRLYVSTAMTGRRGAGVHVLGAIDMALWDLRGKAAGLPVHRLLGVTERTDLTPYASLMPEVDDLDAYRAAMVDLVLGARDLGFRAAKLEIIFDGPYANLGLHASDEAATEVIAAVREAVGADFTLMVDVGYAWDSVDRAAAVLEAWAPFDLYFVETPLWSDDLDGYAALARRTSNAHRRGRVARDALRVRGAARPWRRGGRAARRRPRRRADGRAAGRRARRAPGPRDRPARLEDRHHDRGRRAPRRGHAALPVLRVPARPAGGLRAAARAGRRGADARRRPAAAARASRPGRRARPRRPGALRGGRAAPGARPQRRWTVSETAGAIVVGGGILGCAAALHLAEAGIEDVVVLERDGIAQATSNAGAGFLAVWAAGHVHDAWGHEEAELERYALAFYRGLHEDGHDIGWRPNGVLWAALTEAGWDEYLAPYARHPEEPAARVLDGPAVAELTGVTTPAGIYRAVYHPTGARISAPSAVRALADRLRARGGHVDRAPARDRPRDRGRPGARRRDSRRAGSPRPSWSSPPAAGRTASCAASPPSCRWCRSWRRG